MEGYYAVGAFVSEDVCNQSPVYPGTAKSVKPSSSQGYPEGDDKYQACFQYVDVPARWGYAITMESEKAKYKQIKAKYKQIKAKYEQIKAKYEQIILSLYHIHWQLDYGNYLYTIRIGMIYSHVVTCTW